MQFQPVTIGKPGIVKISTAIMHKTKKKGDLQLDPTLETWYSP